MALEASAPQIIEHISQSLTFTPFSTRWVPSSARLIVMGQHPKGTAALKVYKMQKGKLELQAETEKGDGIKCGTFNASLYETRQLATGDVKGGLNIYDLEKLRAPVFSVKAHESIVNCIDGCGGMNIGYGAPEIVTGGRDGCVRVWDPRQQQAVTSLEPAQGQKPRDCWAVCFGNSFSDEERCVCAGYDNGDVKLLDLRTNKILWEYNLGNGVVGLEFDRRDIPMNKLVATTLESCFSVFDMRTMHPEEGFAGLSQKAHKSTVWQGRHLPQNRDVFATTGGNGTLNLYKYKYPQKRTEKDKNGVDRGVAGDLELLNSRRLSDQPIISLDWSPDKQGLMACVALDQTVKVVAVTKLSTV